MSKRIRKNASMPWRSCVTSLDSHRPAGAVLAAEGAEAVDAAAPVGVRETARRRLRLGHALWRVPTGLPRRVAAPGVAAAGGEEIRLSMPFHPSGARNTTSAWLRSTR